MYANTACVSARLSCLHVMFMYVILKLSRNVSLYKTDFVTLHFKHESAHSPVSQLQSDSEN